MDSDYYRFVFFLNCNRSKLSVYYNCSTTLIPNNVNV
jgi:hypothetical protein